MLNILGFNSAGRYAWVDFMRGVAMYLVVLGHLKPQVFYFVFTSPIKMPIFFIISGYLLSLKKSVKDFSIGVFYRLVVPWILLSFVLMLLHPTEILSQFKSLLLAETAWFMPCIIIDSFISFAIVKTIESDLMKFIFSLALCSVGLMLTRYHVPNYCMFNTALVCQFYMIMGHIFKKNEDKMPSKNTISLVGLSLLYFLLCFMGYSMFHANIDVHLNKYYDYLYCFLLILLGCGIFIFLSQKMIKENNIFSMIGQHTLLIYLWHGLLLGLFHKGVDMLGYDFSNINFWVKAFYAFFVCVVLMVISVYMGKYLPLWVGKGRLRNCKS